MNENENEKEIKNRVYCLSTLTTGLLLVALVAYFGRDA